jgi:hypothetical protein
MHRCDVARAPHTAAPPEEIRYQRAAIPLLGVAHWHTPDQAQGDTSSATCRTALLDPPTTAIKLLLRRSEGSQTCSQSGR